MKFAMSLEMVDLDHQFPNRNRRESKYFWEELYTLISAAGFKAVELNYSPKWSFGGRSGIPLTKGGIETKYGTIKNYLDFISGLGISKIAGVHFDPSLFAGNDIDIFFGAYNHFANEALDFAIESGCEYFTLTPTPCIGILDFNIKPSSFSDFSAEFLAKTASLVNSLASKAKSANLRFCIKNEYWSLVRGESILSFIKQLDEGVLYDLDTANLVIAETNPVDMLKVMAARLGVVHFTDTSFKDNAEFYKKVNPEYPAGHATQVFCDIGQGSVDFPKIYKALRNTKYNDYIVCNCRQALDICRALLRTRYYIDNTIMAK
jgi:Xylose isomerase-like TIM barrel.